MQKLPIKWRVFRIVNFIQLSSVTALIIWIGYMFLTYGIESSSDLLFLLLVIVCAAVLLTNSIFNHILLEHKYPDKFIEKRLSVLSIIVVILALIVLLLIAITYVYSLLITFRTGNRLDLMNKLIVAAFTIILLSGFYVCIRQFFLKRSIRRNHRQSIESFLDINN